MGSKANQLMTIYGVEQLNNPDQRGRYSITNDERHEYEVYHSGYRFICNCMAGQHSKPCKHITLVESHIAMEMEAEFMSANYEPEAETVETISAAEAYGREIPQAADRNIP